MTMNLITILAPGNEKLNVEVDATGIWTLRKNSTPNWRQYCAYPNGTWVRINGLMGPELDLYDANKQRCFSLFEWGRTTGKALCDKKGLHGNWVFTTTPKIEDSSLTIGLGFKAGGFLPNMPIAGGEAAALLVYTPDQGTCVTPYGMPSVRFGLGGGASAGPIVAIIRGFGSTSALHGFQVSGCDCNISLGSNVNSGALGAGVICKLAGFFDSLRRSAWHMAPENWEALLTIVKNAVNEVPEIDAGIAADLDDSPSVSVLDIPYIGQGVELSFFYMAGVMFKMDFLTFSQWMTDKWAAENAKTQG